MMLEHPPARYPGASLHPRASGPHMSGIYPPGELSPHQHDAKPTALPDFQYSREQGKKQTKNPTTGLEKDAREMPKLGFL